MSLSRSPGLVKVAQLRARELRRHQTRAEALFWDQVRNRQLHGLKFYRQHPVFVDEDGRETFYILDFYCHQVRLGIELDGRIHEHRIDGDRRRTMILKQRGVQVLRFTNDEIEKNMNAVMSTLLSAVDNDA
ncbi:MAG: endonuclease domain-containing protein [Ignavibacteria bacterium]|nr:endonuclease domain-containing protein [Ignavibacteria bacterium]